MTPKEILIVARDRISDPANWLNRCPDSEECSAGKHCAFTAIDWPVSSDARLKAEKIFVSTIGSRWQDGRLTVRSIIAKWNDADNRTHGEVLAAFDRAIEAAS